jgi:UDP-N-acetylmuramyl-tripeptide synthetase
LRGAHQDGHAFAAAAVAQGATAVLADQPLPEVGRSRAPQLRVPDVARALTLLAPKFYNHPSLRLRMVGVTGTNGKTTITYLVRAIVQAGGTKRAAAHRVGLLGTIRHELPGLSLPSLNTTPPVWELQRLLAEMLDRGCDTAVLEVSSHALALGRTTGCEFDVAVFTNLSREHLDFHRNLGRYAAAKRLLFTQLAQPGFKPGPKYAVVNCDDSYAASMARAAAGARVLTFGLQQRGDFRAEELRSTDQGNFFRLVTPAGSVPVQLPLVGEYNVANALAAAAVGHALGATLPAIRAGLESVRSVAGRMERLPGSQPFSVIVDYAHKPVALEQTLRNVRQFTRGRVIVVFGCGGERDTTKRAPMGESAARLADEVILTSDNPRSEDPQRILDEIAAGCKRAGRVCAQEPDRGLAIRQALSQARAGDTVLIAGKGHETYQILKDRKIPFSDSEVALRELAKLGYKAKKTRRSA